MRIDYEQLEDEYGDLPKREAVHSPTGPVGSLTDNAREQTADRNGAHKRANSRPLEPWSYAGC